MEDTMQGIHSTRRLDGKTISLLVMWALLAALAIWMAVSQDWLKISGQAISGPDDVAAAAFTEATGVRLLRVAITSGGGMIDVRYQVVDGDKAVVVHEADDSIKIIDERSGSTFSTPWHDHSHSAELHPGVTYFELLMNGAGGLKRGRLVTVMIGDWKLEHVPVQ